MQGLEGQRVFFAGGEDVPSAGEQSLCLGQAEGCQGGMSAQGQAGTPSHDARLSRVLM